MSEETNGLFQSGTLLDTTSGYRSGGNSRGKARSHFTSWITVFSFLLADGAATAK